MSDEKPVITQTRLRQPSLLLMTWTHIHTCNITSFYKSAPSYAPLYIPTSIRAPNLLALLSSDVDVVAELRRCDGVEHADTNIFVHGSNSPSALLPVHATVRTKQHRNVDPLLVNLKRCKRGDVLYTFDPSFPLPNWFADVACGLRGLPTCSDGCIIQPNVHAIAQSSNIVFASRNLGNLIPCADVDVVANTYLHVNPFEVWVPTTSKTVTWSTMPRIDVIAKTDIRVGEVLVLEHATFRCDHGHSYMRVLWSLSTLITFDNRTSRWMNRWEIVSDHQYRLNPFLTLDHLLSSIKRNRRRGHQ
jgi:hypothetical protein